MREALNTKGRPKSEDHLRTEIEKKHKEYIELIIELSRLTVEYKSRVVTDKKNTAAGPPKSEGARDKDRQG